MKKITLKEIEIVMQKINEEKDPYQFVLKLLDSRYPAVCSYIYNIENGKLNDDEYGQMFLVIATALYVLDRTIGSKRVITENMLDMQLRENFQIFNNPDNYKDNNENTIGNICCIKNDQTELIDFLLGLMLTGPVRQYGTIRQESFMPMIIYFKTILDCMLPGDER